MTKEKLEITEKQRLMAIGMMAVIEKNYTEARKYEEMLIEWFKPWGAEDWIADEIYGHERFDFDIAFKKMGGSVIKDEEK